MQASVLNLSPQSIKLDDQRKLDTETDAEQIIVQVFNMSGTYQDLQKLITFYGPEKVTRALLNADFLTDATLAWTCLIFDLLPSQFVCCKSTS